MDKYIINTFQLQQYQVFLKDLFFEFDSFVLVAICFSVSLFGRIKYIRISFPFLVFLTRIKFHVCAFLLE